MKLYKSNWPYYVFLWFLRGPVDFSGQVVSDLCPFAFQTSCTYFMLYMWSLVQMGWCARQTFCEALPKGSKVVSFLYINELIPVTMRGLEVFIIFSNSSSFLLANIPNHELYKCILLFQQQRTLTQALQRNVSLSYSNCFSVSRSHQHV